MKNKLIACVLSVILVLMIVPYATFADNSNDPSKPDIWTDQSQSSSLTTTTSTKNTAGSQSTTTTTKSSVNPKITKFSVTFVTVNSVKLSWSKVAGATSYMVYRSVGTGKWTAYKRVNTNSFTDKKLSRGKIYRYKVCALKSGKSLCYSNINSISVLSKSVGKVNSTVTKKYVKLDFKSTYGANGYEVKYSTNKSLKGAKKLSVKKPTAKLTKLKKNTKYYVSVRAYKVIKGKKVFTAAKKVSFKTK